MFYKPRPVPIDLIKMRSLHARMNLTPTERKYYLNREKGFEGEVMFDKLTEKLESNCLILNDLLFELNNTEFQIDTTIIFQNTISLFDVKNYEGDYYMTSDRFYTKSDEEISNPLLQLERSQSLFRQLLKSIGYQMPVEASVVFINPEFTLYQTPLDKPIIFPTQVNRLMKNLNSVRSKLNDRHTKLAEKLVSLHKTESRNTKMPAYEYGQLEKAMLCGSCHSPSFTVGEKKVVCGICGAEESIDSAILRTVRELMILFPDLKITTNLVQDWCRVIMSKKTIRRVLKENFKAVGDGRWLYFK
ncbi:nuclease-related domain-containing protein [Bacillus salipaludis]|uniref:nuclease-related domain-containing protein n=1 Tax=Bacillus salipaludis TaxID=2547811 RepID=UPI002E2121DE|nr:nuclease-related domain-containing protein [Bacillus salipaludis]